MPTPLDPETQGLIRKASSSFAKAFVQGIDEGVEGIAKEIQGAKSFEDLGRLLDKQLVIMDELLGENRPWNWIFRYHTETEKLSLIMTTMVTALMTAVSNVDDMAEKARDAPMPPMPPWPGAEAADEENVAT